MRVSSVATITATGLATGVGMGTSTISAQLGAITGSTVLTVTPAALQSIALTPASPSIAKGLTLQFAARGTYTDNTTQDLTSQVAWASATTAVATISAGGLATADPAAEPAPFGVGTVGARPPGDKGKPRFSLVIERLDVRVTGAHPMQTAGDRLH